ncbi:MAG: hypothetical protein Q8N08_00430 [Methanobacteriaceae archaeon]|nr:hypothetical protein [Methanobacteriaceae archaeon]
MLGIKELKENNVKKDGKIECPVKDCGTLVELMTGNIQKNLGSYLIKGKDYDVDFDQYFCKEHKIFISPTSFLYNDIKDNLLWYDEDDKSLLEGIKGVKRFYAPFYSVNSEDAVSWNVFRFLERNNDLLGTFLTKIILSHTKNELISNPKVIYWSYSLSEKGRWNELEKVRKEFGEKTHLGSEPDLIVLSDKVLFFIEAKFAAKNENTPRNGNSKKYETGGNNWFTTVFQSDYKTVAIVAKKYELMRFWLLGTWIAKQLSLDFYLVNLVLAGEEKDIELVFKKHINEGPRRKFIRITWEEIYDYISNCNLSNENKNNKNIMMEYFMTKTIGYDKGRLKRAFSFPELISLS